MNMMRPSTYVIAWIHHLHHHGAVMEDSTAKLGRAMAWTGI